MKVTATEVAYRHISVYLGADLFREWKDHLKTEEKNGSEIIRNLIRAFLDKKG